MRATRLMVTAFCVATLFACSCRAEAVAEFHTKEVSSEHGYGYIAYATDGYLQNERIVVLAIGKTNVPYGSNNFYFYKIQIIQPEERPLDIRRVILSSEYSSVSFEAPNPPIRDVGTEIVDDRLVSFDTGKVNKVILDISQSLRIRIITRQNQYCDFYASPEFIDCLKKVANWS